MLRPNHPPLALPARSRRGFTLVELLVACGLVVLILTILAVAFGAATESLGRLKGTGDMATSLRVATDRLKADLNAPHFDAGESTPAGMRLSDLKFHLGDAPPTAGYFRIEQLTPSVYEGQDSDAFASTRAVNHALEFTTKREGRTSDDLFSVNATTPGLAAYSASDTTIGFNSKWARVRWELRPNPVPKSGVQTYTLYRSVRAVVPQGGVAVNAADTAVVAVRASDGLSASLADLATPALRTPLTPAAAGTATYGDDIVLTDVLSFEVKPTWEGGLSPRQNIFGPAVSAVNLDYPYDDIIGGVFDTGPTAGAVPLPIRVTGVQVKIRVFDPKHNLARQVTFQVQQ